jgi:hypothetical protein
MNYRTILSLSAATCLASIASAAAAENAAPAASAGTTSTATASAATGEAELSAFTLPVTASDAAEPGLGAVSPETFAAAANAASGQPILNTAAIATAQYSGTETAANGGREDSYTVLMNQDAFFGFYPSFNGLIPVGENVDFSFYGILWTTTSFGNGGGNDLWTEFGVGAAFYSMEGNLIIKPQLGITNGALLSRGVRDANDVPTGTGGNFADGIVPSLTVNYSDDAFEAEYYGGYYAALRNRNDTGSLDFLHTWINAGAKFSDKFSAGAHYELLSNTRNVDGAEAVVYQWVGPYVQIKTDNGFFARFTAGADIEDGGDGDFYKLTAGFTF